MELLLGDCKAKLKELEDNSIDAIVTDPPYGLSFMGKKWDYDVPSIEVWQECLRVLKPGGYLLSFAGTRTQHRMAVNIEDAGFEIRDMIAWVYGSGFPKSLNIGKAVDKLKGNKRETVGEYKTLSPGDVWRINGDFGGESVDQSTRGITKGNSEWEGWGTALKPALEPITVARKPLEKGLNVASNCLKWGVGGINIDGCRVEAQKGDKFGGGGLNSPVNGFMGNTENTYKKGIGFRDDTHIGRFPANLIHDGSDEVVELFPQTKGEIGRVGRKSGGNYNASSFKVGVVTETGIRDKGSASRFFYCAKASKRERNIGCEGLEERVRVRQGLAGEHKDTVSRNSHPTVKPIALMEYLVKLVSREGQVVLDPFMGSGTTGMACKKLNREFVGIEMMPEYMEIAKARIDGVKKREQLNLLKDNK